MTPSPGVLMALILALSVVVGVIVIVVARIWGQLRTLPAARVARLLEDLARRQGELETILARVELAGEGERRELKAGPVLGRPIPPRVRLSSTALRADVAETVPTGPTLITIPSLASPPEPTTTAVDELGRRFGAIWDLADAGASPEAIARGTGQPIGQVELILALRRPSAANPGGRS